MRRRVLAGIAPIVLAVPMSLAVASPASAAHRDHDRDKHKYNKSEVTCDLSARRVNRGWIKLTLKVDSSGRQGDEFDVEVSRRHGRVIIDRTVYDENGRFTLERYVRNRPGVDRFKAEVKNQDSRDSDTCYAQARGWQHHDD